MGETSQNTHTHTHTQKKRGWSTYLPIRAAVPRKLLPTSQYKRSSLACVGLLTHLIRGLGPRRSLLPRGGESRQMPALELLDRGRAEGSVRRRHFFVFLSFCLFFFLAPKGQLLNVDKCCWSSFWESRGMRRMMMDVEEDDG